MRPLPATLPRLSALPPDALQEAILARTRAYDLDAEPAAIVERALAYPFDPPPGSYVIDGREPRPLRNGDIPPANERHAVLAYGSNSSTRALLRKFAGDLHLPVLRGTLRDFEVVYSSHLSAYGSIPVTLHPAPGARIETFVVLVDDRQFVRLAETEFNYAIRRLDGTRFEGPELAVDGPIAFVSRHGALGIDGRPMRLVDASQREVQDRVRAHLEVDESPEDFIVGNVRDAQRAVAFTAWLRQSNLPFDDPRATVLDV